MGRSPRPSEFHRVSQVNWQIGAVVFASLLTVVMVFLYHRWGYL
jgi:hypothetical protein